MTAKRFKNCLIEFDKTKQKFEIEKTRFVIDVMDFMTDKDIPVKVLFFGDTFGLDIAVTMDNANDAPRRIPLNVLSDFCEEFGCDFEYTACDGGRWIFSFNGLYMEY